MQDPLALRLLNGELRDGEMIVVDEEQRKLIFFKEEKLKQAA